MKKVFFLFWFLLISAVSHSQWAWLNPLPQGNTLSCVKFVGSDTGYASTYGGTVVKTTNSGIDWTILSTGTTARLTSVYAVDVNTVYAVGDAGTIVKTTNGGCTWVIQVSGTIYDLNSVFFTDSNTGFVVGPIVE